MNLRGYLLVCFLLVCSFSASATVYTVTNLNDTGVGSLRQAIADANAADGNVIQFDPSLSGTINVGSLMYITASTTINGNGNITLSGQDTYALLAITDATTTLKSVVLRGINLTHGKGGAVGVNGTTTIVDFTNGAALYGAITCRENLTLEDVNITNNAGGAVYVATLANASAAKPNLTVNNCYFSGNSTKPTIIFGSSSTSFTTSGILNIDHTVFDTNIGNVVVSCATSVVVKSTSFTHNTALTYGGAMLFQTNNNPALTSVLLENVTAAFNSPSSNTNVGGVAMFSMPSTCTVNINNCTFYKNTSPGYYGTEFGFYGASTIQVNNSIIYGGTGTDYGTGQNTGTINISFNNCILGVSTVTSGGGTETRTSCLTNTDPKLATADAFNGGFVKTLAMADASSPAINFGNATGAPTTDARGYARDGAGGKVDAGAYERAAATFDFTGISTPPNNSTNASTSGNLSINYGSPVTAGTGNIYVYNSANTLLKTIAVTSSSVTFSGNQVNIAAGTLPGSTALHLQADAGAFKYTADGITATSTAIGSSAFTFTTTASANSSDASLSALTTTAGTLTPSFTTGTVTYAASVANGTASVTVTPTVNEAHATIQVKVNSNSYATVNSGSTSNALALNEGSNIITIHVTAQDASTKDYTITVTRASSTTLTSLAAANTLSTSAATVNYTATFAAAVTGLTASNFTLSGTGTSGASIGTPTTSNNITWNVPVTTGATGTLLLTFANATNLSPSVSNAPVTGNNSYTIIKTPALTTVTPATLVTTTGATLAGNITSDGGASITDRGFVYGASASPVIGGSGVTQVSEGGTTTGAFSKAISGLNGSTTYHFQAYATNSAGTTYGGDASFSTTAVDVTGAFLTFTTCTSGTTLASTGTANTVSYNFGSSDCDGNGFTAVADGTGVTGTSLLRIQIASGAGALGLGFNRTAGGAAVTGMHFKSTSGNEFKLTSFDIVRIGDFDQTYTIVAYRDGSAIPGSTVTKSYTAGGGIVNITSADLGAFYNNVDEILITTTIANGVIIDNIKTAAPIVSSTLSSLTSVNTLSTSAATVNYTATFAAAVTGLTASNFTLSGTGTSGASVGTPTTSDNITWNIPVTTGANGTLLLTFANATNLSPSVSNAPVAGNNSYTVAKTPPDLYVDGSVTASGDGSTWAKAYKTLTEALTAANAANIANNIYIAKGTYYPGTHQADAFVPTRGNIKIYGGYPNGGGTRNITTNATILSGDIGTANVNTDNSYHVMVIAGLGSGADSVVVDGLTITGGNATSGGGGSNLYNGISIPQDHGGGISLYSNANGGKIAIRNCIFSVNTANYAAGMYITASSPALANCLFSRNTASAGGALYNDTGSSPTLTNCNFLGNSTDAYGGGIYNYGPSSSAVFTNCNFSGNSTGAYGGSVYNGNSSTARFINCSFSGNKAGSDGGAMCSSSSTPVLTNCIIWGNSNAFANFSSTPVVTYSDVQGGYTGTGNINLDPKFTTAPTYATAPFITGDYTLQSGSPAIDAGSSVANTTTTDLAGKTRIVGTAIDMGAYENATITLTSLTSVNTLTTNAATVNYTATFAAAVTGLTASNFTLSGTGATGASVGTPTSSNNITWNIPVTTGANGTLLLTFANATNLSPGVSNAPVAGNNSYTIDKTAPTVTSILQQDGSAPINGALDYQITFSEPVNGLDGTDFTGTVTGTVSQGTASATVTPDTKTYNVTITGVTGDGTYRLDLKSSGTGITDIAGNALVTGFTSGDVLTIDHTAPAGLALSATTVSVTQATNGSDVAALSATDAAAITYALAAGSAGNDADNAKFTISGAALKTTQDLAAGVYHIYLKATDAAGNNAFLAATITVVDIPVVSSIVRTAAASAVVPAAAASVSYTVTFSQAVTGVDASDFTPATTAGTATGIISAITGSGTTYTIILNGLSGDGSLRLDLNSSGTGIKNGSSVAIATGYTTGETYTLDHTAPSAPSAPALASGSDSGTANNDGVTRATAPVVSGTAEANATVRLYDTDGATLLGTTIADGSGNWSITSATLTPGTHTLTVKATDAAGNISVASGGLSITIDTTAPTLAITSNVSALKAGETATITFTFSEDPGVTFAWNGSAGDVTVTGGTLGAISGTGLTRTATFTPTPATNNGTVSITVAANSYTDAAGNNGGAGTTPSLIFDTLIPSAPSTPDLDAASDAGTSGTDNLTNVSTPTFTGIAETNATVKLYDTDGSTLLGTTIADGSGNWSITSATLTPGTHTLTVKATDAAGNISVASGGLSITIDTTAPTLAITSNVSALKAHETATITFTFSKDPGTTFAWDGTAGDVTVTGGTLGAISGTGLTRTATFTPTPATNNGTVSITVAANSYTDAAGNNGGAGTTPAISFDTKAPNFPSAPATTGTLTNITINNPTFTGTAEANSTVRIYDTDKTTLLGTTIADGSGNWSIISAVLPDASHTIRATATDAAGNVSEFSNGTVITINTAPTIYASGTLTSMVTTYGIASTEQSITVSGTNLTEGIKVTAPNGFELSKDNSGYAADLTVGAAGTVSATTIYVRLAAATPAGPYNGNVAASSNGATTVNIATNATNTVNKANATISLSNLVYTYDGTAKSATAATNPVNLSGVTITYGGSATPPAAANTYAVVASLNNANYTATNATDNLVISPKTLTVTATASNKGYDGTANATVTLSDNRIIGDTFTTNYTAAFDNKNQGTGKTVNITGISISGGASANYTLGNNTATAMADIAKKAILVTAQTDTRTYDGTNASAVAPVTDALASGDVIATAPVQTFDNRNAGTGKTLTAAGLAISDGNGGANYSVSYVPNTTGQINVKAINVTAQTDTRTYDGTNASAVAPVTGTLITGDVIATAPVQTFDTRNAGTAKVLTPAGLVISDGNGGANYSVSYIPNTTGVITAATLTYTANAASRKYGVAEPAFTGSVTGFAGSDTQGNATTGTPAFNTTATVASPVGSYAINGSGLVAVNGNYTFIQAAGNAAALTIGKAPVTVTAAAKTKVYGSADPQPGYSITAGALANGDTFSGNITRDAGEHVGAYTIKQGNLALNSNYTLSYIPASLTITPADLTVKADNQRKTYGQANPALTVSYTGFVNGDDKTRLTTQSTIITTATAGSAVGAYPITASGAASGDYTINYAAGTLTVTNAALMVTADDQARLYGQPNPALTVSYSGFVNGDDKSKLTTAATAATTATPASGAGSYAITASGAAIPNYTISYTPGSLTIGKATLTITAGNQSRNFGQDNPALTVAYSGFVNGDDASKLTSPATATTTATPATAPGTYAITPAGAASANYSFTYVNGALTIIPLTIADLNSLTISQGSLAPVFDKAQFSYRAEVANATGQLTLTPVADPTATIRINGTRVDSGSPSFYIPLNVGDNTLTVEVTAQDGLTKKTYTLTVYRGQPPVTIQASNILTPNGDGKNDQWVIKDIQLYPNNTVTIYDRAGRTVYEKRKYANEWDGTLRGVPLEQGTYYYTIDLGPGFPKIKGFITILHSTN